MTKPEPWFEFNDIVINREDLPRLLSELSLMPLFLRRLIERECSKHYAPTSDEQTVFQQQFLARERITNKLSLSSWLEKTGISEDQISIYLYRALQLEQFKIQRFSRPAEQLFLDNKSAYDKVSYSLIRTDNRSQAIEIHLRLVDEEESFSSLASDFSLGPERNSNGLLGPMELGLINSALSERLRVSKIGQLWPPFEVDNYWVLLRLERHFPAQYDDAMRQKLIGKLYEAWIFNQVKSSCDALSSIIPANSSFVASGSELSTLPVDVANSSKQATDDNPGNIMSSLLSKFRAKL